MLDEEMDHIIRDAASNHYPAYNDKAWEKMEIQLDKHLPQNRDRKKFIFFLLFFLLLGGGAFFTVFQLANNKNSDNNKDIEYTDSKQPGAELVKPNTTIPNVNSEGLPDNKSTSPITVDPNNSADNEQLTGKNNTTTTNVSTEDIPDNKPTSQTNNPNNSVDNTLLTKNNKTTGIFVKNKTPKVIKKGRANVKITAAGLSDDLVQDKKPESKNNMPPAGKTVSTVDKMNIVITPAGAENNETENITAVPADLNKEKNATEEQKGDPVKANVDKKEKEIVVTENKTPASPGKKKPGKDPAGNFGITFSAGPDLSFIKLNKLGKATLIYGAGLSYNFKKRITVRAGFYSSKKIYTATPEQYQAPPAVNYYYLDKIAATCRIYEIPVSLSYNFWQRKNHNWFGSAGLSSFLMKNEYYDYQYKTQTGYTYNYPKEISNENKHYFAVLTLSAGYQYELNKRVSLQAEPYVKLPLSGVGLGKVKLNSSGILFTVTVKPFAKGK